MTPMRSRAAAALLLAMLTGCGFVPSSEANKLQADNRRLSEQSRSLLSEVQNLQAHAHQVENQLLAAEEDLAAYEEQSGIDRQKLANLQHERAKLGHLVGRDGRQMPLGAGSELAALAEKYPNLQYDPQSGISKLDTDILFDSGEAELKPGAARLLDELGAVLQSPGTRDLKVMVVGHTDSQGIKGREARSRYPSNWHLSTARAQAVAGRLRAQGLEPERLGVAGFGQHQPIATNDTDNARQQNRRVEIFLMSPDVPVVGMTDTLSRLY